MKTIFVRRLSNDLGLLILRVVSGGFLLPHGLGKLFGWFGGPGLSGFGAELHSLHLPSMAPLPEAFALVQTILGISLLVGSWTRISACLGALFLAFTIAPNAGNGWFWMHRGVEYPIFWCLTLLSVALLGAGAFSVDRWRDHPLR